MAQLVKELKGIRNELRQLLLMYKQLAEKTLAVVEPDDIEKKAIRAQDKIVSEKDSVKFIGHHSQELLVVSKQLYRTLKSA